MSGEDRISETDLLAHHAGLPGARGEGDLAARIAADPAAQATLAEWRRQDAALAAVYGPVAQEPVPERLRSVLRGHATARMRAGRLTKVAALVALVAVGAAGGWGLARLSSPTAGVPMALAEAAQRAHATYAVEVVHPVEVTGDNRPHLAAWLSKRVGRQIRPPDLSSMGYALLGGRVLPAETGAAALLMYENTAGQRVTIFVEPGRGQGDSAFQFAQGDRLGTFFWDDEDLSCAISGDLPRDALRALALESYAQLI